VRQGIAALGEGSADSSGRRRWSVLLDRSTSSQPRRIVSTEEVRRSKAEQFRRLHEDVLILPNAWDPPSAYAIATAGAPAVATTSAGIAWSRGVPDAGGLTLDDALDAFERIVSTVEIPVSADVERGYAGTPDEIAANVALFVERGAAGVNLEDSARRAVVPLADQVAVLSAVRAAAEVSGVPVFVNARCDVLLFADAARTTEDLVDEVIERAGAYQAAGADGLFVPGLTEPELIRKVCAAVALPVNIGPVTVDPSEVAELGARRVTWGPGLSMSTYGATRDHVAAILRGDRTYSPAAGLNLGGRWPA
jgi:2-methylisocitrate lyase-like PEP mutase family enzyme